MEPLKHHGHERRPEHQRLTARTSARPPSHRPRSAAAGAGRGGVPRSLSHHLRGSGREVNAGRLVLPAEQGTVGADRTDRRRGTAPALRCRRPVEESKQPGTVVLTPTTCLTGEWGLQESHQTHCACNRDGLRTRPKAASQGRPQGPQRAQEGDARANAWTYPRLAATGMGRHQAQGLLRGRAPSVPQAPEMQVYRLLPAQRRPKRGRGRRERKDIQTSLSGVLTSSPWLC